MNRTFEIADIDWCSEVADNAQHIQTSIEQASTFECDTYPGEFDEHVARNVAEAYAEHVHWQGDHPRSYDLLVWEQGAPDVKYRVKVAVDYEPTFSGSGDLWTVPA